ncbi:septum site-determining protein MinC [Thermomicrobium sp. CFH 73360]|uniref:septum site-determining protein MinC n=1 Tax=Thermomicrobium sp. CFH 73360 TaxID=2951987 RepID=UPI002076E9DB|nr:septum site-determining protein MinC [Thermomicrobium sp. CFH 73360]MCM8745869.1 septum site-determining protein MinC [Thermomicrobium sp. CFH 73360]
MLDGQRAEAAVRVRGTQDGVRLLLPPTVPFATVLAQVQDLLETRPTFFHGSALTLDFTEREPQLNEIVTLQQVLDARGVRVQAISAGTAEYRERLARWGYRTEGAEPVRRLRLIAPGSDEETDGKATYVRRTLRSGMAVEAAGHLVLLGDVNPGALVVAGGDVLVWGVVRGTVHAGRNGDTEAVIAALRLAPMQLRIANLVARAPDRGAQHLDAPALARVADGQIVIEPWRIERR